MEPVGLSFWTVFRIFCARFFLTVFLGTLLYAGFRFTLGEIRCGDPLVFPDHAACQRNEDGQAPTLHASER